MISDAAQQRSQIVLERIFKMKKYRDHYSQNWEEYERVFKLIEEEKTGEDAWRSKLPDSWSYSTIKTAQAAFVDSKIAPVFAAHEKEDQTKTQDLRDLYEDISDKGDIDKEMYWIRLNAFKLGMGIGKTVYVKDERKVRSVVEFDPDTEKIKYKEETIKDFDDPKTVSISPWMFLADEMGGANPKRCAEIEVLRYEDAKKKYGHLVKDWDRVIPTAGALLEFGAQNKVVAQTSDENKGDVRMEDILFFAPFEIDGDYCEILHYWDEAEDTYEILINRVPVQVETPDSPSPIPYLHKTLPYEYFPFSPYSKEEFWAAGIIELGRAETKEITENREMMHDRQKLSLFSPMFLDFNTEIDQRMGRLKPLGFYRTKGGTPTQFKIPGLTDADIAIQRDAEDAFKRTVGIDERVLGVSPEGARLTATEVSFLREAALRRLRDFAFLYKDGLKREVKIKLSLFKQYYANPLKAEPHVKNDELKGVARQFKSKKGLNTYVRRDIKENLFNDEVDIDLDMRVLVPMTAAQQVAKWSQLLRDMFPLIQAGLVDYSLQKISDNYVEALTEAPAQVLREDEANEGVILAEGEHKMIANPKTSEAFMEMFPEGTPEQFVTSQHLRRHKEMMQEDDSIGEEELARLAKHMELDLKTLRSKVEEQMAQAQQMGQAPMGAPIAPQETPTPPQGLQEGAGEALVPQGGDTLATPNQTNL